MVTLSNGTILQTIQRIKVMKSNKVKEISLIGILAAVNIASRIYLQALPNIKPVTSIIIISVMLFGLAFGVKLSVVTTVVSNLFLGMGTWTFFQILAWVVICLITQFLMDFLKKIGKEPKLFPMAMIHSCLLIQHGLYQNMCVKQKIWMKSLKHVIILRFMYQVQKIQRVC